MPGYYIYTLGDDGHVQGRVNVMCDDDEQATGHLLNLMNLKRECSEPDRADKAA
jgi:hypothetical protein